MFRKSFFTIVAAMAILFSAAVTASAQVGELRGKVFMTQADGTKVPLADAVVDVYRTDISSKYNTKTNKKGEWIFAGIPYIGTYTVAVSHPTAQPTWQPGVKAGRDVDVVLTVSPGDGKRLTLEDIKGLGAATGTPVSGSESAADRAKREEAARKIAEIEAKNKKIGEANEAVERTFKAGNEALVAKNYDLALTHYDEGLKADPEHPGVPSLMTNKAVALTSRGIVRFNASINLPDETARKTGTDAAKKDWKEAAEISSKAVTALKAQAPSDQQPVAAGQLSGLYYALSARAEAMRYFVTKVDTTQADQGITAYQEYIAQETDPVKKAKAERAVAQMLFDANAFEKALAEYQKILSTNPDDVEALLRSGQLLFNIGAMNNDKGKYQEAANFLQRFVDKAPDTDPMKGDARAILENLKSEQNVKAEKTPTPARRTRRP